MELLIPDFIKDEPMAYSASVAEVGDNAGRYAWSNAKEDSQDWELTDEEVQNAREYFADFGAWEDIHTMPREEVVALITQWVAGSYREYQGYESYEAYSMDVEAGIVSGDIFKDDEGTLYIQLGS